MVHIYNEWWGFPIIFAFWWILLHFNSGNILQERQHIWCSWPEYFYTRQVQSKQSEECLVPLPVLSGPSRRLGEVSPSSQAGRDILQVINFCLSSKDFINLTFEVLLKVIHKTFQKSCSLIPSNFKMVNLDFWGFSWPFYLVSECKFCVL